LSITGSLVIFVIIWWIIFFSLLPLDVNREKKAKIRGSDAGAPENPRIIKKFIYSTLITSVIFIIIYILVKYEFLNIRNLIS
tara:strand:+ start:400 stop:645 length:246 start_codon:yes stop_codon:yes gene_type:complete